MEKPLTAHPSDSDRLSSGSLLRDPDNSGHVLTQGHKLSDEKSVVVEIAAKPDGNPEPTCVADIPGIRQVRQELAVLLTVVVVGSLVWMAKWGMLPQFLLYRVVIESYLSVLALTITTGFSLSILTILVSDILDVIWLICLLQYLWNKYTQSSDIHKWDYITELLKTIIVCLTHVSLVLLVVCFTLDSVFTYSGLRLKYSDTYESNIEALKAEIYIINVTKCVVFKAIFYTVTEYVRQIISWANNYIDNRTTPNRVKQKEPVVQRPGPVDVPRQEAEIFKPT